MHFNLNYESVPLLFFFGQHWILGGLLLYKGWVQGQRPARWLGAFALLSACYITPWMCGHAGWYAHDGYREFLFFIPFQQFFLLGPVIYLYVRTLLAPETPFRRRDALHFVPGALYLLYALLVFLVDVVFRDEFYFYADGRDMDLDPWYQITGLATLIFYTGLSIYHYNGYRKRIYEELSYAETVKFAWLRRFLIVLLLVLVARAFFFIISPDYGEFSVKWWYYLLFAGLSAYIAFAGHVQAIQSVVRDLPDRPRKPREQGLRPSGASDDPEPVKNPQGQAPQPSGASDGLEPLKKRLVERMEAEQLYQNPSLTVTDVAEALGVPPKQISQLVNQGFNQNFNDFVNAYRVEAVKARIRAGDGETYTLLSIAFDCGFNSKSTFNRVFKKWTQQTPLQFSRENGPAGRN